MTHSECNLLLSNPDVILEIISLLCSQRLHLADLLRSNTSPWKPPVFCVRRHQSALDNPRQPNPPFVRFNRRRGLPLRVLPLGRHLPLCAASSDRERREYRQFPRPSALRRSDHVITRRILTAFTLSSTRCHLEPSDPIASSTSAALSASRDGGKLRLPGGTIDRPIFTPRHTPPSTPSSPRDLVSTDGADVKCLLPSEFHHVYQ